MDDTHNFAYNRFIRQIEYRAKKYGNPLPHIQKIKAGRAIAHEIYPHTIFKGVYGHNLRQQIIKELLNSIGSKYTILIK